ncbi:MAG: 50S ribosomal protein L3 [Nanoarchaeota archaeon]|nr:50S ribosomal protein L3 [Nanoarchaeota archaeon]
MGAASRPRRGSLQYWPRKRAKKSLPSVNWNGIEKDNSGKKIFGIIGYKVGMKTAYIKDLTEDSMTQNKRITVPVTIIECPGMKIFSVRFYKNGVVKDEVISQLIDKEVKRKIKVPKNPEKKIEEIKNYDDIRIIVYSLVSKTGIKKKPDMVEIGLGGSCEEKLSFVKEHLKKEILVKDIFENSQLVDVRGVTKGKGTQGPVKRFGITLRSHKAEKGARKVGSIGPWHPARVTFRVPMAGQLGGFTRAVYNNNLIIADSISNKNINFSSGFKKYGNIKTDYLIITGSVQGPSKCALVLTQPLRATKKQSKKTFEFIELR